MIRRAIVVVSVVVAALAGQVAGPGSALANKPTNFYENNVHFECGVPGVTTPDGTILVNAEDSSEFGRDASILWWIPPDSIDTADATFRSSSLIEDQVVTRTGYHFDIDVKMEDRDFTPVGNATASIDLIPTGEVTPPEGKSRFGNRTIRDNSTVKFFTVAGTVTMHVTGHDPTTFDVTNCGGPDGAPPDHAGFDTTIDVTTTDPSQFVLNKAGILVLCDVQTDTYSFNFGASSEKNATGGQTSLENADGGLGGETQSGLTLTSAVFSGSIPLIDFSTGDPAGVAVVDATFAQGDHTVVRETQGSVRDRRTGFLLIPSGSITFPTSPPTVVDLSGCFAFDGREQQKEHRPKE